MTQEEKARRYDESLEMAKSYYNNEETRVGMTPIDLEAIFPELCQDERIRKCIIELVKYAKEGGLQLLDKPFNDVSMDTMLAWIKKQDDKDKLIKELGDYKVKYTQEVLSQQLKKQCEQKSSTEVNPKFEIDDWITCEELNVAKIVNIDNDRYEVEFIDGYKGFPHIDYVDRLFHLWTIKDAKDGDVLASELCDSIILFKGIKDNNIDFYCDYDFSEIDVPGDRFSINNGQHYGSVEDSKDFHPATKEQRDLLFQKMKEAGYEWDTETHQLKKIEDEEYDGEDYGIDSLWHAKNILEKTLGKVGDYQTDDGILSHQCAITAVKKLYEQKSDWSEEDEVKINRIVACLENLNVADNDILLKDVDWLKSLKERIGG